MTKVLLTFLISCATMTAPQDPAPPAPPASGAKPPTELPPLPGKEGAAPGRDASSLQPGVLPESASPAAREAWERICRESVAVEKGESAGAVRAPVTAFVLDLDVRYRGGPSKTNDLAAQYRFLAPGFVRVSVEGKRDTLRGPDGDWLVDRVSREKINLGVAREHAEDRRQLDETVRVAKTFVALTDPKRMRIATLEVLLAAPKGVLALASAQPSDKTSDDDAARLQKRAGELAWLKVTSPDFHLIGADAKTPLFRAALGFDRASGWVEVALVEEDVSGASLRPSARLLELRSPKASQGFRVPQQILVYSPEEGRMPPAFAVPAGMDLWVKSSDLRATFTPDEFRP